MLIAEVGSVHDGSFGNACKLVELAKQCGADAVKFQTHIANAESLKGAPSPSYFSLESRIDYFNRTSFTLNEWIQIKELCDDVGIAFLSSPFSIEAAEMLQSLDMKTFKIPSGEITNLPLLEKIASFNKSILLSSGMSNWKELDQAYEIFKGRCDLTIMQCSSMYPCPPENVGLNVLKEISDRYECSVGFSDHTLGLAAPLAAAALGATVIEKHFTFSRSMYGSDAQHSMEPNQFKILSQSLADIWRMLENPVNKNDLSSYASMKSIFQKSIVSATTLSAGTLIEKHHLAFKKPGTGIPASEYAELLGKRIMQDCPSNEMLQMDWFQ